MEIKRLSSYTKTWLLDVLVNSAVELCRKTDYLFWGGKRHFRSYFVVRRKPTHPFFIHEKKRSFLYPWEEKNLNPTIAKAHLPACCQQTGKDADREQGRFLAGFCQTVRDQTAQNALVMWNQPVTLNFIFWPVYLRTFPFWLPRVLRRQINQSPKGAQWLRGAHPLAPCHQNITHSVLWTDCRNLSRTQRKTSAHTTELLRNADFCSKASQSFCGKTKTFLLQMQRHPPAAFLPPRVYSTTIITTVLRT